MRELFHDLVTFFADTYRDVFGMASPPMHDPVSVFAVLATTIDPSLAPDVHRPEAKHQVFVVTDGDRSIDSPERTKGTLDNCGRTILRPGGGVIVPKSIDVNAFWSMIDIALESAQKASPMG